MALKHGAHLVPVLSFGENEIYSQAVFKEGSIVNRLQKFVTKLIRFSPPLFYGRGVFQYTFGILPYRKPITTVVGTPIAVSKVDDGEPSQEEVDALHKYYCSCLVKMYNEHKSTYGSDTPLIIK